MLTYPIMRDTKLHKPKKPAKPVDKKIKCETKGLGSKKKCSCNCSNKK